MLGKIILHQLTGNESQALLFSAELKGAGGGAGNRLRQPNGTTTEATPLEPDVSNPSRRVVANVSAHRTSFDCSINSQGWAQQIV